MAGPSRENLLIENLRHLAGRLPQRAFETVDKKGPLDLRPLYDIVATLEPERWKSDRLAALLAVLEAAVDRVSDTLMLDGKITWREAARTLYNLDGQEPEGVGESKPYSILLSNVRQRAQLHLTEDVITRRITEGVRTHLAREFLSMEERALYPPEQNDEDVSAGHSGSDVERGPHQLPAGAIGFVGRGPELKALDGLLGEAVEDPSQLRIAAVHGLAGVGKTGLALRWGHSVRGRFDGELYVDLRGYSPDEEPVSATEALARFLRSLGMSGDEIAMSPAERAAQYRNILAGRKMLIVLDNALDTDHVRLLLPGSGPNFVVVTSRDYLTALHVRHGAQPIEVKTLPLEDAVSLLRLIIGERVENEPEAASNLAKLCGRLPLALRLIAGAAIERPNSTLASLNEELSDESQRLDVLDAGGDPETDLRAVFSWSYRQLDSELRRAFSLFSLMPGTDTDAHTAAALLGTQAKEASGLLTRLTRVHMIEVSETGRYNMHDLIHLYGREQAVIDYGEAERTEALDRAEIYYLAGIGRAMDRLYPHEKSRRPAAPDSELSAPFADTDSAARAWMDRERGNQIATGLAARSNMPIIELFSSLMYRDLEVTGHYQEALTLNHEALAALRADPNQLLEGQISSRLGLLSWRLGNNHDAIAHLKHAQKMFEGSDEPGAQRGSMAATGNLAVVYGDSNQLDLAIEAAKKVLNLSRKQKDRPSEAYSLTNLGSYLADKGRHKEALGFFRQALPMHAEIKNPQGEAITLSNMAESMEIMGHAPEAKELYTRAWEIHRRLKDADGEGRVLNNLSIFLRKERDFKTALQYAQQAYEIQQRLGSAKQTVLALVNMAQIFSYLGQHSEAEAKMYEAATEYQVVDDPRVEAELLHSLAVTRQLSGDAPGAVAAFTEACNVAEALSDQERLVTILDAFAELHHQSDDERAARAAWERALEVGLAIESPKADDLWRKLAGLPPARPSSSG